MNLNTNYILNHKYDYLKKSKAPILNSINTNSTFNSTINLINNTSSSSSYFDISSNDSTSISNFKNLSNISEQLFSLNTQSVTDINSYSLSSLNKYNTSNYTVNLENNAENISSNSTSNPNIQEIETWVKDAAKKYNIDYKIIMAVINTESSFNSKAVSKSGAVGLMQLMPVTAREMGLTVNSTIDERLDPKKNIEAGVAYLAKYHKIISNHFGKEDWNLSLAGYNCGPNRVIREGKIPNIAETQNYVKKINKYLNSYS